MSDATYNKYCPVCGKKYLEGESCEQDGSALSIEPAGTNPYIGKTLKRVYKIEEKIAEGGMGVIYRAKQIALGRDVAIKIIHSNRQSPEDIKRFLYETKLLSQLNHPNIVTFIDFGNTETGLPYMVMEYLVGNTLYEICKKKGLSLEASIKIMVQICEGVEAVHQNNLVHRDLTPYNIFLSKTSSNSYIVKILDFGIAKSVTDDSQEPITEIYHVLGVKGFLAPERILFSSKVDLRIDIYALGSLLYFMISGNFPYHSSGSFPNSSSIPVKQILFEDPLPIDYGQLNKPEAKVLQPIINKAMDRSPKNCYQSVTEFKEALLLSVKEFIAPNEFELTELPLDLFEKNHNLAASPEKKIVSGLNKNLKSKLLSRSNSLLLGIDELWEETLGDSNICIAILDGQPDLSHPCFINAKLTTIDTVVSGKSVTGISIEHGTNVASIIFGTHTDTSLVKGIAPHCRGLLIPIFGSNTNCSQLDLARAISFAVQHGANIINISGGQLDNSGEAEPLLADAIELCARNNVLIVAAAGNNGCDCLHIPAALPSALAVGAMDIHGSPLENSNWGKKYQTQGILAPGQDILVAMPGGTTALRTGTSFATPIVSGIVALLLSLQLKQGLKPNPNLIRQTILDTAIGCDEEPFPNCQRLLAGRVNIIEAMKKIKKGESMSEQRTEVSEALQIASSNSEPVPENIQPAGLSKPNESGMIKKDVSINSRPPQIAGNHSFSSNTSNSYASGVFPSGAGGCGCGGTTPPALTYVLGQIGFDFGTEARRDSFLQQSKRNTELPKELLEDLQDNPVHASSLIWTLTQDTTPIYAVQPSGPFAAIGYDRLREFLKSQQEGEVERVSIPGVVSGKVTLLNGHTIPVLYPEVRGMYSWSTAALVEHLVEGMGDDDKGRKKQEIHNFLQRVYYEVRSLGRSSQERAINYAATNAFQVTQIYKSAIKDSMTLNNIGIERSPICRPGSDCWDIKLVFFNPSKRFEQARRVYRFTVDVSDTIPVTVGEVRDWYVY